MWKSEVVERALFAWPVWRESIIRRWMLPDVDWAHLPKGEVRDIASKGITSLGFPYCLIFEIYWLSCLVSDYCMSDPTTFSTIAVPDYLPRFFEPLVRFDKSMIDKRAYPPPIYNESDLKFHYLSRMQHEIEEAGQHPPGLLEEFMFLPSNNGFWKILSCYRGRPKASRRCGRQPMYSDRLAVYCAKMKSEGSTYVEIARKFILPITIPEHYQQSDAARYLVKRGQVIIESIYTPK
jgi:hypothetical protein